MPETRPRSSGRIPELEGLRAVLAWTVVVTHILICSGWFGWNFGTQNLPSEIAAAAVDAFIMLSGFVITRLVLVERESYGRYLFRRACRIVPAYWVALALAIALNSQMGANLRHLPPTLSSQFFASFSDVAAGRLWTDSIMHFLLVHGLAPSSILPAEPYTFLGVAWSLSLEWQFYCVAPLLLFFATRTRFGGVVIVAAAVTTALFSGRIIAAFSAAFLPAKAIFFLVGALTYIAVVEERRSRNAFAVLAGMCVTLSAFWWIGCGRSIEVVLASIVWMLVICAVRFQSLKSLRAFLDSPPLQFLGRVSYSTYLFHAPLITLLQAGIWRWINPRDPALLLLVTALPSIFGTFVVSALSWRWIEKPFQRLGRDRFSWR
ncbi:MAG: acyltransferase [Chthoniobacterales bacterium]|nr:acyltransferase [Chthoniobacterales bacterium]